ncbi:MAG: zinc ribbon domain-containing protein [Acidobacteria bacterium]|nr:MAG: zinc ribbon domain-containing protein [Acidobacteriota bacterium]
MYCPSCGRRANDNQRYCTSCGVNLVVVREALSGRIQAPDESQDMMRLAEIRRGLRTMMVGLGLMVFFYYFFGRNLGFAAIGAIVFFAGLSHLVFASFLRSGHSSFWRSWMQWPQRSSTSPSATGQLSPSGGSLKGSEPPPSVTEHTTVRLPSPEYAPSRETLNRGEEDHVLSNVRNEGRREPELL